MTLNVPPRLFRTPGPLAGSSQTGRHHRQRSAPGLQQERVGLGTEISQPDLA
jgi:hypothetical protein